MFAAMVSRNIGNFSLRNLASLANLFGIVRASSNAVMQMASMIKEFANLVASMATRTSKVMSGPSVKGNQIANHLSYAAATRV